MGDLVTELKDMKNRATEGERERGRNIHVGKETKTEIHSDEWWDKERSCWRECERKNGRERGREKTRQTWCQKLRKMRSYEKINVCLLYL